MKKEIKLPEINLKELEKQKADNFKDRLEFISRYAEWIEKNPNKKWSMQQSKIIA